MEYQKLAQLYKDLESTQKNLEKTEIIATFYSENNDEVEKATLLILGRPYPKWKNADLGVSSSLMKDIIAKATGKSQSEIEELWKKEGDLGLAAEKMVENKTQQRLFQDELTVEKVLKRLRKIADMEKSGISESVSVDKKKAELAELISSATPLEARYVTRTILSTLRLGVGESTVRDALAQAFFEGENKEEIQRAFDVTNDFEEVANECKNKDLEALKNKKVRLFRPISSMLAKKVDSISEAFETVGKPAAIDYKYDGFRAQIHKEGDEVKIFSRRLEDVTNQFPDVKEYVRELIESEKVIIDTEIVGYDPETKGNIPFQKLSKRIKRKYEIQKLKKQIPVEVRPFDLIYNEETLIDLTYESRWKQLKEITREKKYELRLVDHLETDSKEKVSKFRHKSLEKGNEGIMMKNIEGKYKPGSRVGYMVKLKPVMETLDLAIIGGEWSEGRRTGWIGSLTLGCWNESEKEYQEIGKMATGLTDEQLQEITGRLEPLIINEDGRDIEVKPRIIVEAEYEELQKSPTYSSGFALRFPRLKRFRDDKEDADTLNRVKDLYNSQN